MEKFVFIVALLFCSMITSGMGVKCYLQQCERKSPDDPWTCFTDTDGMEKECSDGCAESNEQRQLIRTCSDELPHGGPTKGETGGKICSEKIAMTRDSKQITVTNCHCKTPMCNNITKLGKVEVMQH